MGEDFSLSRFLTSTDWVRKQAHRRDISSTGLWTMVTCPAFKSWSVLSISVAPNLVPRVFYLF